MTHKPALSRKQKAVTLIATDSSAPERSRDFQNQRRITMNLNRLRLASIIAAGFAALVCSQPASAQSDHTFLSVHGVDSPTCGAIDSPCRTFSGAITNTNPNGEVIAIDSGVYVNPDIVISKSITLSAAPGAHVELSGSDLQSFDVVTVNLGGD